MSKRRAEEIDSLDFTRELGLYRYSRAALTLDNSHTAPSTTTEDVTPVAPAEDDSDDDFGPMPMPADAAVVKKRRGALSPCSCVSSSEASLTMSRAQCYPTRSYTWTISLQLIDIGSLSCTEMS